MATQKRPSVPRKSSSDRKPWEDEVLREVYAARDDMGLCRAVLLAIEARPKQGLTAKDLGMTVLHAPTSTTNFPPRFTIDQFSDLFGNAANLYTSSTDYQNVRFGMLPVGQQNFPRLIQVSAKIPF